MDQVERQFSVCTVFRKEDYEVLYKPRKKKCHFFIPFEKNKFSKCKVMFLNNYFEHLSKKKKSDID